MNYETKNFDRLLGLSGLSEILLNAHFGLYAGYVANSNKLMEEIDKYQKNGETTSLQYAELTRRFGWEWNGMRLHEYYFSNIAIDKKDFNPDSTLGTQIKKDFESFEQWKKFFRAIGAMRGIGWVILYFDPMEQKLQNAWIGEHDAGHFAGNLPLLVMDVFEHAYMPDYGTKRADYLESFMKAVDWEVVGARYDMATKALEHKPKEINHFGCRC